MLTRIIRMVFKPNQLHGDFNPFPTPILGINGWMIQQDNREERWREFLWHQKFFRRSLKKPARTSKLLQITCCFKTCWKWMYFLRSWGDWQTNTSCGWSLRAKSSATFWPLSSILAAKILGPNRNPIMSTYMAHQTYHVDIFFGETSNFFRNQHKSKI